MIKNYKKKLDWKEKVFAVFVFNALLFFILAMVFDGGAFPWGEIRGSTYWIVTSTKEVLISKEWFWFTYLQGLSVWLILGVFMLVLSIKNIFEKYTFLQWRKYLKSIYIFVLSLVWIFFLLKNAVQIIE